MDSGLDWLIIHRDAPKVWPKLVECIQKALNTDARGGQSEIEVMLAMHSMMERAINSNQQPDWAHITQAATFSLPACTPYIHVLAELVQNNTGAGELLMDLSSFQKAFGSINNTSSKRVLGSVFFSKVGGMNFGKATKCPHVQIALVKANIVSPANKVTDTICHFITPAHITMMTSKANIAQTKEIDNAMADARKLVDELAIKHDAKVRALGQLDVRLVLHVLKLGKQSDEGKSYTSTGEIIQVHELK